MTIDKATLYDRLYQWRDYEKESRLLTDLIREEAPGARRVLDVGCGTAEHHPFLLPYFTLDGIDLEEAYLLAARRKNPAGRYLMADMTAFDLARRYDVVISLFSAIGYVRTLENLRRAAACLAVHLDPGGLLIVEPWLRPGDWTDGVAHMHTYEDEALKICRMNVGRSHEGKSILDFHFLVAERGGKVAHFTERHELGLFDTADLLDAFRKAGIDARFEADGPAGRGLIVGRKSRFIGNP